MPVCRSRNELEQEFTQSGFAIIDYWDIWPLLAMLSVANSMTDPPELVKPLQTRRGRGWSVVYRDTIHRSGSARIVYIKTQSGYTMRLPMRPGQCAYSDTGRWHGDVNRFRKSSLESAVAKEGFGQVVAKIQTAR
jgi:hypothetical protein